MWIQQKLMGFWVSYSVSQTCNQAVNKWGILDSGWVIISISQRLIGTNLAEYNKTQIIRSQGTVGPHFSPWDCPSFKKSIKKQLQTHTHFSLTHSLSSFLHHPVCFRWYDAYTKPYKVHVLKYLFPLRSEEIFTIEHLYLYCKAACSMFMSLQTSVPQWMFTQCEVSEGQKEGKSPK